MENIMKDIKSNWVIIMAIISLIVTWTTFNLRLTSAESIDFNNTKAITDLQAKQTTSDARFQNLEANVYIICKAQQLNCIPPITK